MNKHLTFTPILLLSLTFLTGASQENSNTSKIIIEKYRNKNIIIWEEKIINNKKSVQASGKISTADLPLPEKVKILSINKKRGLLRILNISGKPIWISRTQVEVKNWRERIKDIPICPTKSDPKNQKTFGTHAYGDDQLCNSNH